MTIICFFGPDGSGKTSLARTLATNLQGKGYKTKLSWMRGSHTIASVIARFLRKFAIFKGEDNPYYQITIPKKFLPIWKLIEFISVIPIILLRFVIPNLLGFIVIAERYVPDFIVWVTLTTNDLNYCKSFSSRFLNALALKSKARIYITAEYRELIKRRNGIDYLSLQRQLIIYEKLAKILNAFKLDTTKKSVEESSEILLNFVTTRS
ncbi:MAG: AAA family ATPase [Nitrososphaeria archaeon]|jgi:thymidylate kinase